jgi:hypothetical protein
MALAAITRRHVETSAEELPRIIAEVYFRRRWT